MGCAVMLPMPIRGCSDYLAEKGINTYIQYTLNDYVAEQLEQGVPLLQERIDTFKQLVNKIGFGKVIWRFAPMILTNRIGTEEILSKVERIGSQLKGYTEKLIFSFADIRAYRKVQSNLTKKTTFGIGVRDGGYVGCRSGLV